MIRTYALPATEASATKRFQWQQTEQTEPIASATSSPLRSASTTVPKITNGTMERATLAKLAIHRAGLAFWERTRSAQAATQATICQILKKANKWEGAHQRHLQMEPIPTSTSQTAKISLMMVSLTQRGTELRSILSSIWEMPWSRLTS